MTNGNTKVVNPGTPLPKSLQPGNAVHKLSEKRQEAKLDPENSRPQEREISSSHLLY